jgi:hypothetical protein
MHVYTIRLRDIVGAGLYGVSTFETDMPRQQTVSLI